VAVVVAFVLGASAEPLAFLAAGWLPRRRVG